MSRGVSDPYLQLTDDNLKKYKVAGKVASKVLDNLVLMAKPGIRVKDICFYGDNQIEAELGKVCKDVTYKGVAFPTCVSLNNYASHCSDYDSKDVLKDGDLAKIEFGVHVGGYPAQIVYTMVVGNPSNVNPKCYNVLKAATSASKKVLGLMKPGVSNLEVVKVIREEAKKYGCSLPIVGDNVHAPGVISYQNSRNVVDGFNDDEDEYIHKIILHRDSDDYEFALRELEFDEDEVWAIDIVMTSGTGRLNIAPERNTILKRIPQKRYNLKMKTSRETLKRVKGWFPKNMSNELSKGRFKLGLKECTTHMLIETYPPMRERNGEYVARVKFTVIVRDDPILITGRSADDQLKKLKKKQSTRIEAI